eukprot:scaffold977_cov103-Isochrysis_galbana.AAC.2
MRQTERPRPRSDLRPSVRADATVGALADRPADHETPQDAGVGAGHERDAALPGGGRDHNSFVLLRLTHMVALHHTLARGHVP